MGYRPEDDPKTALMRELQDKTFKEQFRHLKRALKHCDKCAYQIDMNWDFCAWCGYQLVVPKTQPYSHGCLARRVPGSTCQSPNCDCKN